MGQVIVVERVVAVQGLLQVFAGRAEGGRCRVGLERMLHVHFLQQRYALSDPALEGAPYDLAAMHPFVGIDLGREPVPDESTACKLRHLLEKHDLAAQLLGTVNLHLQHAHGLKLSHGRVMDATVLRAPSSTKIGDKAHDPQRRRTWKGEPVVLRHEGPHWRGRAYRVVVHSVTTTAANEADVTHVDRLLHGREKAVFGDAGYTGAPSRCRPSAGAAGGSPAIAARDQGHRRRKATRHHAGAGACQGIDPRQGLAPVTDSEGQFGHVKIRYRGLARNGPQVVTLFALANLWIARKRLLTCAG